MNKILAKITVFQLLCFGAVYSAQSICPISSSTIGLSEYTKLGNTDKVLAKCKKAISDPSYQALQTERSKKLVELKWDQAGVIEFLLIAKESENFYTTVFKDRGNWSVFEEFIEASKSEKRPDRIAQAINQINNPHVKYWLSHSLFLSNDQRCTDFINFLIVGNPTLRKALTYTEIKRYATTWHSTPYLRTRSEAAPSGWLRGLVTTAEKLVKDDFNANTNEDREQLDGPVELYSIAHDIIHHSIWYHVCFYKNFAFYLKKRFENRQQEFKCFLESRNLVPFEEEAQYLNSENGLIAANYQGQNALTDEEVAALQGPVPDYS